MSTPFATISMCGHDMPASGVSDENLLVLQISEPLLWNCLVGLMLSIAVEGMVRFYGGMNV
jgi:hypothetical protein